MPGGASCPSFIPADLINTLKKNQQGVEVASVACAVIAQILASSVFLAPAAACLAAVSVVLTSLSNDCDLGASMQSTARQAALGCKIGATVATIGVPFTLGASAPIAGLLGALAPVLDAIGAGKAPKLADVGNFAGQASSAGAKVDPNSISSTLGPVAGVVGSLGNDSTMKSLVAQIPTSQQSTAADADAAFFATVRKHIALGHPTLTLDQALAPYTTNSPANSAQGRFDVLGFVSNWKAAGQPDDAQLFDLWDQRVPKFPFTSKERALASAKQKAHHNTALNNAKEKARENTAKLKGQTGSIVPFPSKQTTPNAPVKVPLSKGKKIAVGAGVAAAAALLLKFAVFA